MGLNKTRSLWTAPQLLQNNVSLPSPETHASNVTALTMLSFIALLTNVGVVIGLPLDITKADAQNIQGISLMFSKIMLITMITYLLMQITTYQVNAESSTDQ